MIKITTNIKIVAANIAAKLQQIRNKEYLLRPVAVNIIPMMRERIHVKGLASDGKIIGLYSDGYMKIRTGDFGNAKKTKAGKLKDAGTFTDRTIRLNKQTGVFSGEDKVGKPRPKYNRSNDPKVIISLTRQLENDYAVLATANGYGIGFNNDLNRKKSGWVEKTYKKKIFALTKEEKAYAVRKFQQLVNDAIT